jgi:CRP/FNR family cyclic AMP-dependent transcriptional regulator
VTQGRDGVGGADDPPALADALGASPLFAGLAPGSLADLRRRMTDDRLPRGGCLFTEGDRGERMYVVLSGTIKVAITAADGRENLLALLGPGDLVGELSLFDLGPRTATVTAVTDARLAALDHDELTDWLAHHPPAAELLLAALAGRLRRTNAALADLMFSDVPGRVAKTLLDLADRFGRPDESGVLVQHGLTQEELSQLVAASRETVNRALADFASRGWLRSGPRRVVLLDRQALARRAR